eukprot:3692256-Amphidinium_carterae.1
MQSWRVVLPALSGACPDYLRAFESADSILTESQVWVRVNPCHQHHRWKGLPKERCNVVQVAQELTAVIKSQTVEEWVVADSLQILMKNQATKTSSSFTADDEGATRTRTGILLAGMPRYFTHWDK